MNAAVNLEGVSERYRIKFLSGGKVTWEDLPALRNVTLKVGKGEVLGVIGENGAGKTTLLKLIAGMLVPDDGTITVQGKVSALMELGAGFNPEFTGRENIQINARVYGIEENSIDAVIEGIIAFAGLGRFIDAPLKYYSQGMYTRLAFALAIYVDPDVLLIDDILAVGDEESRQKCMRKIFELKKEGKTIILVSHDMEMVSRLSDRVVHFEKGSIVKEGTPAAVIAGYLEEAGNKAGVAVLRDGLLRVTFNNGRLIVSVNDTYISSGQGAYVSFLNRELNFWSSSPSLSWKIAECSGTHVVAQGATGDGKILQTWDVSLAGERLFWKIKTEGGKLDSAHIDILLSSDYRDWISLESEGSMPFLGHRTNWQEVKSFCADDTVLEIKPETDRKQFPVLVFKREGGEGGFKLLNTGFDIGARVVQVPISENGTAAVEIGFSNDETKFAAEVYGQRNAFLSRRREDEERKRFSSTIASGNMRLYADMHRRVFEIYYRETKISETQGLVGSFLFNRAWIDTSSAAWEVEKNQDTLVIRFAWDTPKIAQIWKVRAENGMFRWQVECSGRDVRLLEMVKISAWLKQGYGRYFCGHQEEVFPAEFTNWRELALENPHAALFGVRATDEFPDVALENSGSYESLVENSDLTVQSRVLSYVFRGKPGSEKVDFSIGIRLSEDRKIIGEYIEGEREKVLKKELEERERILQKEKEERERALQREKEERERVRRKEQEEREKALRREQEERQKALLREQEARERETRLRTLTSGDIGVFVDTQEHCMRLLYKSREITCNRGLHTWFNLGTEKKSEPSFGGEWQIEQKDETSRTVVIKHPFLQFTEIWTFESAEENTVRVTIELEVEQETLLSDNIVKLEVRDEYGAWLTPVEAGDFSNLAFIRDTAPVRLKDNRVASLLLRPAPGNDAPVVFIRSTYQPDRSIVGLYKQSVQREEQLCLSFSRVIPRTEKAIRKGRYLYFEGEITFGETLPSSGAAGYEPVVYKLEHDTFKLTFERGRALILRGNTELTAGLGVFTSLRFLNIWHDSYQAIWDVNTHSGKKIEAEGYWPHIPVSQSWCIESTEPGVFLWSVRMHVHEKVLIELQQANLMLVSSFTHWKAGGSASAKFPDEYSLNYDILPFRLWYGRPEVLKIEAENGGLPPVIFEYTGNDDAVRVIVENSDCVHRARLLQFQKSMIADMEPGTYPYFTGVIRVVDKKRIQ